jgi:protein-S-isoprenylcysteine O-methyltransferase Ste14
MRRVASYQKRSEPKQSSNLMNPWLAKLLILAATVAMLVIRAPHGHRSSTVPVERRQRGTLELVLLTIGWTAFLVLLVWIATPLFSFADYPLHAVPLAVGSVLLAIGLWLFYRSHADLGTNWSITLELREQHQLVTHGIYRRLRHPMYAALLIYSVGQALVVPNWLAGPSYAVAMVLLIALRVRPEERMMLEKFGTDYEKYKAGTKRLIPGVW